MDALPKFELLKLGTVAKVSELKAKPVKVGRSVSPVVEELTTLVRLVASGGPDDAVPWDFKPTKPATARQQAVAAIKRSGIADDVVHASMKDGLIYFSQEPLSNRGRKAK